MIASISFPRYAYNVTFDELNHAVTKTFLESICSGFATFEQEILKDMKKVFEISIFMLGILCYIIIRVHSAFSLAASCVLLKYTRTDNVN